MRKATQLLLGMETSKTSSRMRPSAVIILICDGLAVYDQFHRNVSGFSNTSPFNIPIWFPAALRGFLTAASRIVIPQVMELRVRKTVEQSAAKAVAHERLGLRC